MGELLHTLEHKSDSELHTEINEIVLRHRTEGKFAYIREEMVRGMQDLVNTLDEKDRDSAMIRIQKTFANVGGYFREYGARIKDYVRNVLVSPMIKEDPGMPMNNNYIKELAKVEAWKQYAMQTTVTATANRNSYKENAGVGAVMKTFSRNTALMLGVPGAMFGMAEGAKNGFLIGGLYGAGIGAVSGAALGLAYPWILRIKDKMLGIPVVYWSIYTDLRGGGGGGSHSSSSSSSNN